jgi:hypothetical protein
MYVYLKELVALQKNLPFLAWTYLKDHDAAYELMDRAVENASDHLLGTV